jgi:hypothetical protein
LEKRQYVADLKSTATPARNGQFYLRREKCGDARLSYHFRLKKSFNRTEKTRVAPSPGQFEREIIFSTSHILRAGNCRERAFKSGMQDVCQLCRKWFFFRVIKIQK